MDFNRFYLASQDLAYAHPYPDFSVSLIPISRPTPTGQYGMRGDCFSRLAHEGPAAPSARDVRTGPTWARPRQARPSRMTPRDFTSEQFRRVGLIRGVSAREVPAPPSARGVRTKPARARPRQVRPSRMTPRGVTGQHVRPFPELSRWPGRGEKRTPSRFLSMPVKISFPCEARAAGVPSRTCSGCRAWQAAHGQGVRQ